MKHQHKQSHVMKVVVFFCFFFFYSTLYSFDDLKSENDILIYFTILLIYYDSITFLILKKVQL